MGYNSRVRFDCLVMAIIIILSNRINTGWIGQIITIKKHVDLYLQHIYYIEPNYKVYTSRIT